MAKVGFWLRGAKGKLDGSTLYRAKGGKTVMRVINDQPTNPRTPAQVAQRIRFSSAALFFKRGKKNLFTFGFQNKKSTWSDYNAFMNANSDIDIYPTYEEAHNQNFPLVGQFIMTDGNLDAIQDDFQFDYVASATEGQGTTYLSLTAYMNDDETDTYTWDQFLTENPQFQVGDILTFVGIVSDAHYDLASGEFIPGTFTPKWVIKQVIVKNGPSLVATELAANGLTPVGGGTSGNSGFGINLSAVLGVNDMNPNDESKYCIGGVVIKSRRNGSKLDIATSRLKLACSAPQFAEYLYENDANAIASWGAAQEAILQGSLVV